jgi:hypothetical protein
LGAYAEFFGNAAVDAVHETTWNCEQKTGLYTVLRCLGRARRGLFPPLANCQKSGVA